MKNMRDLYTDLQRDRSFHCYDVVRRKAEKINNYFSQSKLDAAVLGVSGGVDSAVVLALLRYAQKQPNSPLQKIVSLLLPIDTRGATEQELALQRGRNVVSCLGGECWEAPLGGVQKAYLEAMPHMSSTPWSEGQLLSIVRTPALYFAAAQLQAHGFSSLVVGTTNRDEGAYLGFFGKASDGMVDLQPISDLHKSEVYQIARFLGVPQEVIEAPPSGNVFDGRIDEEMIGAPYWFVEMFLLAKERGIDLKTQICTEEQEQYRVWEQALEQQHAKNAHKYRVGSPAIHFDVLPRAIPGGWS